MSAPYCYNPAHSRRPTEEEFREDYAARVAAIDRALVEGTHSPEQIQDARDTLTIFTGYSRCTRPEGNLT